MRPDKLERFYLASLFQLGPVFVGEARSLPKSGASESFSTWVVAIKPNMLSVVTLSIIMLSVVMLSFIC